MDSKGAASAYINISNMLAISVAGLCLGGVLYRHQGFSIGFYSPLICAVLLSLVFFVQSPLAINVIIFSISLATGLDNPNNNSVLNSFIKENREKARIFAIYTTCSQFFVIISPLIASFLIVKYSHYFAILVIIASYLLNSLIWFFTPFLRKITFEKQQTDRGKNRAHWHGSQLLWRIPALRDLTVNRILNNFLYTGTLVLLPIMVTHNTQENVRFTIAQNFILSLIGMGFILNGTISSYLLKKTPQLAVYFVRGATAVALIGMIIALISDFQERALYVMAFLLGYGQFYFRVSGMTLGQAVTPPEHLGEVILAGDALVRGVTALYALFLLLLVNILGLTGPYLFFMVLGAFAPVFATKGAAIYLKTLKAEK